MCLTLRPELQVASERQCGSCYDGFSSGRLRRKVHFVSCEQQLTSYEYLSSEI